MITHINAGGRYIRVQKYQEQHGDNVNIGLSSEADIILEWAAGKMDEEQRIQQLAKTNPTVADAAEALKKAEEQLRLVMTLSQTVSPV